MQYENEARVFFTAKSENEGFARLFAAGFLTQLDPTISEMTDVKTAVSEAVTNAIIHGYEEKGGLVELFCGYIGRKIYIEIADTGKGIENIERARSRSIPPSRRWNVPVWALQSWKPLWKRCVLKAVSG